MEIKYRLRRVQPVPDGGDALMTFYSFDYPFIFLKAILDDEDVTGWLSDMSDETVPSSRYLAQLASSFGYHFFAGSPNVDLSEFVLSPGYYRIPSVQYATYNSGIHAIVLEVVK